MTEPTRTVEGVTCLACGCLCDDLAVRVDAGRVAEVDCPCEVGRNWFLRHTGGGREPSARVGGLEVSLDAALDRAAVLLRQARAPLVFGLRSTSTETVREALGIADALGARVWLDRGEADLGRLAAYQDSGRVSATLGEVKNRADVVVFAAADPLVTHPRHWERYSVEPAGRFVPGGRAGRFVVVIDDRKTATAERADLFVPCPPDREYALFAGLRALVSQPSRFDAARLANATGVDRETLEALVSRLKSARYGAVFAESRQPNLSLASASWNALSALVRDLNAFTRCVLLGMGAAGNLAGAEAALTWQTGFPQNVDFGPGSPTPLDDMTNITSLIERGETDLVLAVADELPGRPGRTVPVVAITPDACRPTDPAPPPAVAVATAAAGLDGGGSVTRCDGIVLPLNPPLAAGRPSDLSVLRALSARLIGAREPAASGGAR